MAFYMRNYSSEEKFDIAKFLNFSEGVFDVIDSPFLAQIQQLPPVDYYNVDERYREIDMISQDYYGDQFYSYLIQFYNGDFRDTFPEGTILKMFSLEDLNEIYYALSLQSNLDAIEGEE